MDKWIDGGIDGWMDVGCSKRKKRIHFRVVTFPLLLVVNYFLCLCILSVLIREKINNGEIHILKFVQDVENNHLDEGICANNFHFRQDLAESC